MEARPHDSGAEKGLRRHETSHDRWQLIGAVVSLVLPPLGCDTTSTLQPTGPDGRETGQETASDTASDVSPRDGDTEDADGDVAESCGSDAAARSLPEPAPGQLFSLRRSDDEVAVDGELDELEGRTLTFSDTDGDSDNAVTVASRWTSKGLYFGFDVDDAGIHVDDGADAWKNDGVEIAVDPDASGESDFAGDERKWLVEADGNLRVSTADPGFWETVDGPEGIVHTTAETDDGYLIELMVDWSVIGSTPSVGREMAAMIRINDRGAEGEIHHFSDRTDRNLASPATWGRFELAGERCLQSPGPEMDAGTDTGVSDAVTDVDHEDADGRGAGRCGYEVTDDVRVLDEDRQMGHGTFEVTSEETVIVDGNVRLTWDGFDSPDGGLLENAVDIAGTVCFANEGDRLILDQTAENLGLNTNLHGGARFGDGRGTIIYEGEADLFDLGKDEIHWMLFPPRSGKAVVNGVAWPDGSGKMKSSGNCDGKYATNIGFSWAGYDEGDLVMKNTLIWGFSHNLFYWRAHHGSLSLIDSSIEHSGSRGVSIPEGGLEMRDVTLNIGGKNAYQLFSCGIGLTGFQVETDDGNHREAHLENVHVISRSERYDGDEVRYPSDGSLFGRYYENGGTFTFHLDNAHSEAGGGSPSHVTLDGSWGNDARRLDHSIVDAVTN